MTPELETVLQISAIGTGLLFTALAGLIGLMYLLTAPWMVRPAPAPGVAAAPPAGTDDDPDDAEEVDEAKAERDRQRRAVAIAVAVACAHAERAPMLITDASTPWRRLHHTRRLSQPQARTRARS